MKYSTKKKKILVQKVFQKLFSNNHFEHNINIYKHFYNLWGNCLKNFSWYQLDFLNLETILETELFHFFNNILGEGEKLQALCRKHRNYYFSLKCHLKKLLFKLLWSVCLLGSKYKTVRMRKELFFCLHTWTTDRENILFRKCFLWNYTWKEIHKIEDESSLSCHIRLTQYLINTSENENNTLKGVVHLNKNAPKFSTHEMVVSNLYTNKAVILWFLMILIFHEIKYILHQCALFSLSEQ